MAHDGVMPEETRPQISKQVFMEIAEEAVKHSGQKLRLAHNERDDSKDTDRGASHFIKLEEKRLGRDIEIYQIMSVVSPENSLVHFLTEVIYPIKSYQLIESYNNAGKKLRDAGLQVFQEDIKEEWKNLF